MGGTSAEFSTGKVSLSGHPVPPRPAQAARRKNAHTPVTAFDHKTNQQACAIYGLMLEEIRIVEDATE
jgi:hypothetical protein